jgi:hypothetical protein
MTARWAHLPYEFLEHVSNRIVNEIEDVSRVVYDPLAKQNLRISEAMDNEDIFVRGQNLDLS